ncbi:MAG: DHH family phosphoesterase [Anaerolineae bacterium]|nr:DHH family phosphoesterase [Anaerolineae bacterium]
MTYPSTSQMVALEQALEEAAQLIHSASHPLLVCHISPDGDAIGSLVGLGQALCYLGQCPLMVSPDPLPPGLRYIPGTEEVVQRADAAFDLVISLDCSDLERLGQVTSFAGFGRVPLINVDHHLTNLYFGNVNLVDIHATSTAEVVLRLLDHLAVPLDEKVATCLLTGIVTDTRGFRTSNVTIQTMEAATRLMRAGASLPYITRHGLDSRPTSALLLWKEALASLQLKERVAWATVSLSMRHRAGYEGNGDAGLVDFLLSASDADVAAVFVERKDGYTEIGLRAMPGYDVARVAQRFGGGGHALAAGCKFPGLPEEAQTQILPLLWEIVGTAPS